MVDSGIKCDSQCLNDISELEKGKFGYVILQICLPEDGGKLERVCTKEKFTVAECEEQVASQSVELKGGEAATWYCFRKALEKYDIAYGVGFVHYTTNDKRETTKLVYVNWNTDNAKTKDKMKYSSTKVINKLKSAPVKLQVSDADEITYDEIVVRKLGRK